MLLADRAYGNDLIRQTVAEQGGPANIKPLADEPLGEIAIPIEEGAEGGDVSSGRDYRAVAIRFEKHDANYLALVKLAASRIWMRLMSR